MWPRAPSLRKWRLSRAWVGVWASSLLGTSLRMKPSDFPGEPTISVDSICLDNSFFYPSPLSSTLHPFSPNWTAAVVRLGCSPHSSGEPARPGTPQDPGSRYRANGFPLYFVMANTWLAFFSRTSERDSHRNIAFLSTFSPSSTLQAQYVCSVA